MARTHFIPIFPRCLDYQLISVRGYGELTYLIKTQWQIFVRFQRTCHQRRYFFLVCWGQHHGELLAISQSKKLQLLMHVRKDKFENGHTSEDI